VPEEREAGAWSTRSFRSTPERAAPLRDLSSAAWNLAPARRIPEVTLLFALKCHSPSFEMYDDLKEAR